MNRQPFYDHVTAKLFHGSLPDWQRQPLDQILDEAVRRARRLQETAYVLATGYHETGRFKHDEEIGQGQGRPYGIEVHLYSHKKVAYFGRSWPQHTWLGNYAKMSIAASLEFQRPIDFVNNPDLIKDDPALEGWAMWEGFVTGMWTGKNLADYFSEDHADYVEARRIVNGTDKAELIAGYAREFEAGLRLIDGGQVPQPHGGCPLNVTTCPRVAGA
ncbi:hypothetical protein J7426_14270 [Tropicibacter sp. R16_0]|uniref:hypothetical protein n=1 Tax=Tropicibacter sp. R16_0 TaxID=2821102 RepID=UPI001AD9EEC1|nr:hypothetical protein [Tropicibacter sp. R16_0]MBO9451435.1 hypothetical protein [Tropicibacter sp. R16_0]